jgi:hypothetical protein
LKVELNRLMRAQSSTRSLLERTMKGLSAKGFPKLSVVNVPEAFGGWTAAALIVAEDLPYGGHTKP